MRDGRRFVAIGPASAVPAGTVRTFYVEDREVVVANVDGELYALAGRCPHQGGPLGRGTLTGDTLTCPWHLWSFDVRSGRARWPEGVWRVACYPLEVADGEIRVGLL